MWIISNSHVDAHLLHLKTWTSLSRNCGSLSHKMSNLSNFRLCQVHSWHRTVAVPSHLHKKLVVQTVRNWSESWTQIKQIKTTRADKKVVPPPSSNTWSRKIGLLTMSVRNLMTSRQGHWQLFSICSHHRFLTSSFCHRKQRTSQCIQHRLSPNEPQWFSSKSRRIIA